MKTAVDERLRREVARYRLKFSCADCAYFDVGSHTCSEGYPTEEHARSDLAEPDLLFCKLFEVGV